MNKVAAYFASRWKPIAFWIVVVVVAAGISASNRSRQASLAASLENPATRDATVRDLVANETLLDVLANTEDPNGDSQSEISKRSNILRENATLSVNKLVGTNQVTDKALLDSLLNLYKDSDSKIQDDSVAGLTAFGHLGDAKLAELVNRLKDGDPGVRTAAGKALKAIGGDRVADLTDRLLKDTTAQADAEDVLGNIGGVAIPYAERRLTDSDLTFRLQMLKILGTANSPAAIPDLLRYANHGSAAERRMALNGLTTTVSSIIANCKASELVEWKSATPPNPAAAKQIDADLAEAMSAAPTLIGALKSGSDDSDVRAQSAITLGSVGTPAAIDALVGALDDYDLQVVGSARDALQATGRPAIGPLTRVARTGTGNGQVAAVQALAGIPAPSALSEIDRLLADSKTTPDVRRAALTGLGASNNPAAVPVLVRSLSDLDGLVAEAAAASLLTQSLEQSAVQPLIAEFDKPDPVPFNASGTLSRMGIVAIGPLEAATRSTDPRVETWAAVTLGQMATRDSAVAASLDNLRTSPNPQVRFAATQALLRIQGS